GRSRPPMAHPIPNADNALPKIIVAIARRCMALMFASTNATGQRPPRANTGHLSARDRRHIAIANLPLPSPHGRGAHAPDQRGARAMTKFYSLILAAALLAPMAWATLNQAAQMVA